MALADVSDVANTSKGSKLGATSFVLIFGIIAIPLKANEMARFLDLAPTLQEGYPVV